MPIVDGDGVERERLAGHGQTLIMRHFRHNPITFFSSHFLSPQLIVVTSDVVGPLYVPRDISSQRNFVPSFHNPYIVTLNNFSPIFTFTSSILCTRSQMRSRTYMHPQSLANGLINFVSGTPDTGVVLKTVSAIPGQTENTVCVTKYKKK